MLDDLVNNYISPGDSPEIFAFFRLDGCSKFKLLLLLFNMSVRNNFQNALTAVVSGNQT